MTPLSLRHGVGRPGGSALNSGQVGGVRAADFIAAAYAEPSLRDAEFRDALEAALSANRAFAAACATAAVSWRGGRAEFQRRMTRAGAFLRSERELKGALREAQEQLRRMASGWRATRPSELIRAFENRQLCWAQAVYLSAQLFAVRSGVGSRGSCLVADGQGRPVAEDPAFRDRVQETRVTPDGRARHRWVPRRPLPQSDLWFETAWAAFTRGDIYRS